MFIRICYDLALTGLALEKRSKPKSCDLDLEVVKFTERHPSMPKAERSWGLRGNHKNLRSIMLPKACIYLRGQNFY